VKKTSKSPPGEKSERGLVVLLRGVHRSGAGTPTKKKNQKNPQNHQKNPPKNKPQKPPKKQKKKKKKPPPTKKPKNPKHQKQKPNPQKHKPPKPQKTPTGLGHLPWLLSLDNNSSNFIRGGKSFLN